MGKNTVGQDNKATQGCSITARKTTNCKHLKAIPVIQLIKIHTKLNAKL